MFPVFHGAWAIQQSRGVGGSWKESRGAVHPFLFDFQLLVLAPSKPSNDIIVSVSSVCRGDGALSVL